MKRLFSIVLLSVMILSLCACGDTTPAPTPTPEPTTKPTETPKPTDEPFTDSKAISKAKEVVTTVGTLQLPLQVSGVKSIKNLEIATATVQETQENTVGSTVLSTTKTVLCKGKFTGYDDYGNIKGLYNFDWEIRVSSDGSFHRGTLSVKER